MKECIGNCVSNPFDSVEILSTVIENSKKVSKKKFLEVCNVTEHVKKMIKIFPNDFEFYTSGEIYFFTHSAIECFYK